MAKTWLDLPTEIRLKTYRQFLHTRKYDLRALRGGAYAYDCGTDYLSDRQNRPTLASLLLICRQVHLEVKDVLWKDATIMVTYGLRQAAAQDPTQVKHATVFGDVMAEVDSLTAAQKLDVELRKNSRVPQALRSLSVDTYFFVSAADDKGSLEAFLQIGLHHAQKLVFSMVPASVIRKDEFNRGGIAATICIITIDQVRNVMIKGLTKRWVNEVRYQLEGMDTFPAGTVFTAVNTWPRGGSSKRSVKTILSQTA